MHIFRPIPDLLKPDCEKGTHCIFGIMRKTPSVSLTHLEFEIPCCWFRLSRQRENPLEKEMERESRTSRMCVCAHVHVCVCVCVCVGR